MIAIVSELYAFIAIPLILVLFYYLYEFILRDDRYSNLLVVLFLAYMITIKVGIDNNPVLTILIAVLLFTGTFFAARYERRLHPT